MKIVNNEYELNLFIWENREKLVVLYFGATWCGPCQKLKQRLTSDECKDEMSLLVSVYIDVDNDELSEIVETYNISSLPTQVFISLEQSESNENENEIKVKVFDHIIGYDWIKFKLVYQQYVSELMEKKDEN